MNKYKFGDKVYISTIDMEGKIIGWEYKVINGKGIDVKYSVEIALEDENVIASNVPEKDLEPIRDDKYSCDCCGHDTCENSDYNEDDFENELDDDEIEDYRYNKSCENLDNNKQFNLGDLYAPDEEDKEIIEEMAYERYLDYESRKLAFEKYEVPMGWKA